MGTSLQPLKVWLVDDDPFDVKLMLRAARAAKLDWSVDTFSDGEKVCQAAKERPELPHLILLDLNLPGRNGREVLEVLRALPSTRAIPVVIITTSCRPEEVKACYQSGANTYLKKPASDRELIELLTSLMSYWGRFAEFPTGMGLPYPQEP